MSMETKEQEEVEEEELPSSKLGTLDFWEDTYTKELQNFDEFGDVGEVWFGNESSLRVVRYIDSKLQLAKEARIIDLGCGNGATLKDFATAGFRQLTGVDYSPMGLALANSVFQENGLDVQLQEFNLVADRTCSPNRSARAVLGTFALAHDKGTYDAISLCPDEPKIKRQHYMQAVHSILEDNGFFVISSCNWTKKELVDQFKDYFTLLHEIPTKKFTFGGQEGNTITQLVFVKS